MYVCICACIYMCIYIYIHTSTYSVILYCLILHYITVAPWANGAFLFAPLLFLFGSRRHSSAPSCFLRFGLVRFVKLCPVKKTLLRRRIHLETLARQNTKSGAGEQFMMCLCKAEAHRKGMFFSQTPAGLFRGPLFVNMFGRSFLSIHAYVIWFCSEGPCWGGP